MRIRMLTPVKIDYKYGNRIYYKDNVYDVGSDADLAKWFINWGYAEEVREPTYVPYKHVQEDWVGKTVRTKDALAYLIISGVSFKSNNVWIDKSVHSLEDMFQRFDWADGSPFGEQVGGE